MIDDMRIVSAMNEDFNEVGKISWESIRRSALKHGIRTAFESVKTSARNPSWEKIGIIKQHLRECGQVLWIDADAMIVSDADVRFILADTTLNISRDDNGINCGVMAWKNCDESFSALDRMESGWLDEKYRDHQWFEQSVLMDFIDELKGVTYQPKHIFNAYPSDRSDETIILHFPGMGIQERVPLMLKEMEALC